VNPCVAALFEAGLEGRVVKLSAPRDLVALFLGVNWRMQEGNIFFPKVRFILNLDKYFKY